MANDTMNLEAETGRNLIDDDAEPALTLENTNATGTALRTNASGGGTSLDVDATTGVAINVDSAGSSIVVDVDNTGTGTGVDVLSGGKGGVFKSSATATTVMDISHSVIGSPTVAPLKITTSAASGAVLEVNVGLVSTASLTVPSFFIPVKHTGSGTVAYVPTYIIS